MPQIAGVFGDCIAGGGYMPIISDRVYMTEQAYMVIAGAALIKGAKSQKITSLDIGGPEVHVHQSGCADVRVPDDETLLACIRRDVAPPAVERRRLLPRRSRRRSIRASPPAELAALVPADHREAYDAHQVLARLVDQSLFWEVMPEVGEEMICGVGRIGGLYAGFVINRQGLVGDPEHPGPPAPGRHPLPRRHREDQRVLARVQRRRHPADLAAGHLRASTSAREAEAHGLLAYGSSLIYTNSTNTTPMFTVLLRKASGAGYYAMSGLPYDPDRAALDDATRGSP